MPITGDRRWLHPALRLARHYSHSPGRDYYDAAFLAACLHPYVLPDIDLLHRQHIYNCSQSFIPIEESLGQLNSFLNLKHQSLETSRPLLSTVPSPPAARPRDFPDSHQHGSTEPRGPGDWAREKYNACQLLLLRLRRVLPPLSPLPALR
jgi:hypothetical protein